jgi:hypothetical protein
MPNYLIGVLAFIGFIWGFALTITPYLGLNIEKIKPFIHDQNFLEQLKTPIEWNLWACGLGILFSLVYFTGVYFTSKNKLKKGLSSIFLACLICIETASLYYLPRIENLVQGSMVEFCKSIKGKDVYTKSLYLKSYNQYFYSDRQLSKVPVSWNLDTFLNGKIDKDCYFITRTIDTNKIKYFVQPLKSLNGFTFYLKAIK